MVHTASIMGAAKKPDIQEQDLHGFKHFKLLLPVPAKLYGYGCGRDRAVNRELHFDQVLALIKTETPIRVPNRIGTLPFPSNKAKASAMRPTQWRR